MTIAYIIVGLALLLVLQDDYIRRPKVIKISKLIKRNKKRKR